MKLQELHKLFENTSLDELVITPIGDSVTKSKIDSTEYVHSLSFNINYRFQEQVKKTGSLIISPTNDVPKKFSYDEALTFLTGGINPANASYKFVKQTNNDVPSIWYGHRNLAPKPEVYETI